MRSHDIEKIILFMSIAIKTLAETHQQFNLLPTEDEIFFSEWQEKLSENSIAEKIALDQLHRRYRYQRYKKFIIVYRF